MDSAYAAGFFDGEGSIGIYKKAGMRSSYQLRVTTAQKDRRPLAALQTEYGGHLSKPLKSGVSRLIMHSTGAADFLWDLLPHLIVKKEQAELALSFQSRRGPVSARGDSTPESDAEDCRQMRALKRVA